MKLQTERVESVKAGTVAAMAGAIAFAGTLGVNYWLLEESVLGLVSLEKIAIATFSGFLFGVTYRYIIRQDANPHLKSGAILAFGLVRGLATVEVSRMSWQNLLVSGLGVVESIALFAVAAAVLDWGLAQKWLKPFSS